MSTAFPAIAAYRDGRSASAASVNGIRTAT